MRQNKKKHTLQHVKGKKRNTKFVNKKVSIEIAVANVTNVLKIQKRIVQQCIAYSRILYTNNYYSSKYNEYNNDDDNEKRKRE